MEFVNERDGKTRNVNGLLDTFYNINEIFSLIVLIH